MIGVIWYLVGAVLAATIYLTCAIIYDKCLDIKDFGIALLFALLSFIGVLLLIILNILYFFDKFGETVIWEKKK